MRNPFTANEITILRKRPQGTTWYCAVHKPASIVQLSVATRPNRYPASMVSVTVDAGDITAVQRGMTIVNGGNETGGSSKGRSRIRKSNDGTTSAIQIAELGKGAIQFSAGDKLTVFNAFHPTSYFKRPDPTATDDDDQSWLMDWDIEYDDQYHGNMEPHVIMGPPCVVIGNENASFVGGSTIYYDGTFSTASWTFDGGAPIATSTGSILGTEDAPVVANFPNGDPEGKYVTLRTTDTNGIQKAGLRLVFKFDSYDDASRVHMATITGGYKAGGYKADITLFGNQSAKIEDFPDNAEVVIFEGDTYYGDSTCNLGGNYPFRSNIVFRGWIESEAQQINPYTNQIRFTCKTINGILSSQKNFDLFMTNASATHAFEKWIRMDDATIDKVAHFYTHYMSNIGALTDFNFAGSHASRTDLFFVQALPSAPMWQQLRGNYKSIFGMVAADMQSSIYAFQDVLITGASESFVDTFRIDDEDKRDTITIQHDHQESTAQVELFSLFGATCPTVEPFGAQHPQGAPDYFGGTQEISKGIFADQETLKVWTGNYRAKLNSDYPNVTVPVSPYMKLDSVPQSQVTMSLSPANNPRGLSWVNERFYPHTTTIRYNAKTGVPAVTLTMERFTQGTNAGSLTIPEIQAVGSDPDPDIDDPPDIPTPTGTGQGDGFGTVYVMGTNGLFRTRSFTASPPVWVDITGAATGNGADFILDPFYPTTRGWLATSTGLWRSTDLDQAAPTWTQTMTAAQIFAEMSFSGGYTFHKIARIMGSINKEDYLAVGVSAISGTAYQYGCTVTYDAGTTWSGGAVLGTVQTNLGGDPPYHFFDVVQHLIGGNVRLVGIRSQSSDAKAFYSDNDGVGWTELGAMGGFINQFTPHSVSVPYNGNEAGNIVYFAWGDYRGGTWFAQISKLVSTTATVIHNKSLPATVVGRTQVEAYTQDKDRLAFWSVEQSAPLELHISNDGGATESTVSMTGITGEIRASGGFPYNNSLYYAVTTTGVFVSSDRGSTWTDKTGALSLTTAKGATVIVPNWTEE